MDVHHSVVEAAEVIRRSCAVAPLVAVVSEIGRRRAVATTSCELAEQILNAGRSVAVIDCDFQAPVLHEIWQRSVAPGFSSVLVGASDVDDVFDYRALPTGRFLTVTAGEDSARRSHLFSTPVTEQAVRRLVDFAEIVLVNVGPLSAADAASVVGLCDAIVVVTDPGQPVRSSNRPASLQGIRAPIIAWTPDNLSTPEELIDHYVMPAPVDELVPSWIDDDRFEPAVTANGSVPAGATMVRPDVVAAAPAEAVVEAPPVDPNAGMVSEPAPALVEAVAVDADVVDVVPEVFEDAEVGPPAEAFVDDAGAAFTVDDLWEPAAPVVAPRIPGVGGPAQPIPDDDDDGRKRRKKRRFRTRYLP